MSDRQIVIVDVETNGLDPERHQAVEVAWWNLATDDRGCVVPKHDVHKVLATADINALQVSRYIDRIADQPQRDSTDALVSLHRNLAGNTLAGSNPSFDAAMLRKLFGQWGMRSPAAPWHYRMWDLSAYAAGVLGLDELPGLFTVCDLLAVPPPDHTAEGDVTATGLCFQRLQTIAAERRGATS